MAGLFRNALLGLAPVFGLATAAFCQMTTPDGIDIAFDTFAYDGGTSRVEFSGLQMTQGDLRLEADRASSSSLDFERSEWRLTGNVSIEIGATRISSDEARFSIRNNELTLFELLGQPATFEDLDPSSTRVATGGANRLNYDNVERTLSLREDAWLRVGSNEVTGCDLIYDVDAGTFMSGSTECDQPFRIRISRPAEDTAADPPRAP
jgi:lipopolysaccharide transport protein LptA